MSKLAELLEALEANIMDGDHASIESNAIELADIARSLELDSKRWNAFINAPFRLFGYAGLQHEDATQPCEKTGKDGYAHFGCEMWTKHSGWKAGDGKDVLIGFADQAIQIQAEKDT